MKGLKCFAKTNFIQIFKKKIYGGNSRISSCIHIFFNPIKKSETKASNIHCMVIGIIQAFDILSNKFDLISKDCTLKIQINPNEKLKISNYYIEL